MSQTPRWTYNVAAAFRFCCLGTKEARLQVSNHRLTYTRNEYLSWGSTTAHRNRCRPLKRLVRVPGTCLDCIKSALVPLVWRKIKLICIKPIFIYSSRLRTSPTSLLDAEFGAKRQPEKCRLNGMFALLVKRVYTVLTGLWCVLKHNWIKAEISDVIRNLINNFSTS